MRRLDEHTLRVRLTRFRQAPVVPPLVRLCVRPAAAPESARRQVTQLTAGEIHAFLARRYPGEEVLLEAVAPPPANPAASAAAHAAPAAPPAKKARLEGGAGFRGISPVPFASARAAQARARGPRNTDGVKAEDDGAGPAVQPAPQPRQPAQPLEPAPLAVPDAARPHGKDAAGPSALPPAALHAGAAPQAPPLVAPPKQHRTKQSLSAGATLTLKRTAQKFSSWAEILPALINGDTVIVEGVLRGPLRLEHCTGVTLESLSDTTRFSILAPPVLGSTLVFEACKQVTVRRANIHAVAYTPGAEVAAVVVRNGCAECRLEYCDVVGTGKHLVISA